MSLQATLKDAKLAAYAPFVDRQGGTALVRFVGQAARLTVQIHAQEVDELAAHSGTGFSPYLAFNGRPFRVQHSRPSATLSEKVRQIRNAFGLNIKQFAEVMQVTRVTIYDWIRQDDLSILREGARNRLNQAHMLATVWAQLQAIPGLYLDDPIDGGDATLFSTLKGDELPSTMAIIKLHQLLLQTSGIEERSAAYNTRQSESIAKGAAKILANPQDYGLETD